MSSRLDIKRYRGFDTSHWRLAIYTYVGHDRTRIHTYIYRKILAIRYVSIVPCLGYHIYINEYMTIDPWAHVWLVFRNRSFLSYIYIYIYIYKTRKQGDIFIHVVVVSLDMMKGLGASQRIFELLDRKPNVITTHLERSHVPAALSVSSVATIQIEFEHVAFRYPARPEARVFDDLHFTMYPNETLAIVVHIYIYTCMYVCREGRRVNRCMFQCGHWMSYLDVHIFVRYRLTGDTNIDFDTRWYLDGPIDDDIWIFSSRSDSNRMILINFVARQSSMHRSHQE